jgi:signal transduction histidine kinase
MRELHTASSTTHSYLYQDFFVAAGEALLILDRDDCIVDANPAAQRLLGIDDMSGPGTAFIDLFAGYAAYGLESSLRAANARRWTDNEPVVVWARTSRQVPVELSISPMTAGSIPEAVTVVIRDRSDAVAAEMRLLGEEQLYRTLFNRAPVALREEDFSEVGIWLDGLKAQGVSDINEYLEKYPEEGIEAIFTIHTRQVNPACVTLVNAPNVEAIKSGFRRDELTPEVTRSFFDQFVTIFEGRTHHEAEFVGRNFQNEAFECKISWTIPTVDGRTDLSRIVVALLDVTEVRAAERRLQKLVHDKDRFIASVSHELRTPLATVLGLSEEVATRWDDFDPEEAQSLIGLVAAQAADLSILVEDLLLAAKLEMGDVPFRQQVVDLDNECRAAVADCERLDLPERELTEIYSKVSAIGDPGRVRQILRNLIINALRYGGDHVTIETAAAPQPTVVVRDDGDGIPLEQREDIFAPYHRVGGRGDTVLGSLGLGLTISRQLARLMGGDLTYQYVDGHSIFTVTFRRTTEAE